MSKNTSTPEAKSEFAIHRLYVKDLSFEAPNSPQTFKEDWKPEVDLNLDHNANALEEDLFDVNLKVTVTTKINGKIVFMVEVQQAGIFFIKDFSEEQKEELLASFCPNVLFPYAREAISDLITRGGFPPLYLAPINFDAIFQQRKTQAKAGK